MGITTSELDDEMAAFFAEVERRGMRLRIRYSDSCVSGWSSRLDHYRHLPLADLEDVTLGGNSPKNRGDFVGANQKKGGI
jgi:hypothetical protein